MEDKINLKKIESGILETAKKELEEQMKRQDERNQKIKEFKKIQKEMIQYQLESKFAKMAKDR